MELQNVTWLALIAAKLLSGKNNLLSRIMQTGIEKTALPIYNDLLILSRFFKFTQNLKQSHQVSVSAIFLASSKEMNFAGSVCKVLPSASSATNVSPSDVYEVTLSAC